MANVAHPKHNAAMSHGRLVGLTNPPVRGDGGAAWGSVASEAGRGTRRAGRVETDEGRAALGGSSGGGGFETHHHGNAVPRVSSRPVSRRESRRASRARGVRERDRRRTTMRARVRYSAQRASGTRISNERPAVLFSSWADAAQPSSSVHLASSFVPARCARRSTRVRRDVTTHAPSPRRPRPSLRRVARRRWRRRRPRSPPTPPPSPPPRPARSRPAPPPRANASLATIQIQTIQTKTRMHDPRRCETPRPRARASRHLARRGTTPGRGCERARVAATTTKAPSLFHSTRPIASTTTKAPSLWDSFLSPRRRCSPREGRRVRRRRRG